MRLFVGGMDYNTTEEELKSFFTTEDIEVTEHTIVRDRNNNNRSKGFGFVTLSTDRTMKDVVDEFHKARLGGRNITVNEAAPKQPKSGGDTRGGGMGRGYQGDRR